MSLSFPPSLPEVIQNYMAYSLKFFFTFDIVARANLIHYWQSSGDIFFPLPVLLKTLLPSVILMSPDWQRLPNFLLAAGIIYYLHSLLKNSRLNKLSLVILTITPWFVINTFFDFSSVLTLFLALALIVWQHKQIPSLILILALSFSSLAGLVFGIIFILLHWRGYARLVGSLALAGILLIPQVKNLTFLAADDYSLTRMQTDVNTRVRQETQINNYLDIIPLAIKRIGYNKYFYELRAVSRQAVKVFDWDWLFAPAQIGVTVSRNIWSEKGLSMLYIWQAVLIIVGLFTFETLLLAEKKLVVLTVVWTATVGFVSSPAQLASLAFVLIIPVTILTAHGWTNLAKNNWLKLGLTVLAAVSTLAFGHHFFTHELVWRDNRPWVFATLADLAIHSIPPHSTTIITNILGPAQFHYALTLPVSPPQFWQVYSPNPTLGTVSFGHFDLTQSSLQTSTYYLGLPGEFLGSRLEKKSNDFNPTELPLTLSLQQSVPFRDAVSYGNGNYIWLVKSN